MTTGEGRVDAVDAREGDTRIAEALSQLDLARRRFVNVVGHELRTPVTTLRGLAEELLSADERTMRDELGPALVRNTRRVERLVDDLLLASDITTALPVGDPESVDLVATAQAVWDNMEVGVDLELRGAHEAVAKVRTGAADRLLERVLDNARRYGEPPFALKTEAADGLVRMTVSSAGPQLGEDLELAFEVFYRGEGAVTTAPGFGLGLPVARALARQHGGEVRLAARPGGGLDVMIELPTS